MHLCFGFWVYFYLQYKLDKTIKNIFQVSKHLQKVFGCQNLDNCIGCFDYFFKHERKQSWLYFQKQIILQLPQVH